MSNFTALNQVGAGVSIKSILLAAIGGQGGNVLVEWLFLAAERDGRRAQALSLPGLSQRGGGTTFYLEIASLTNPASDPALLDEVVFAQFAFPGRVDVLVGQELVELGRLVQAGYVSRRTSVVASNQRLYTIDEKMPAFDGVFPSDKIVEATAALAGSLSVIDTAQLAAQNGLGELATNAILLGALSTMSEALPMGVERYREAIKEFDLAVEMNLKAFEIGRQYGLSFNREVEQFEAGSTTSSGFELARTIPLATASPVGEGAADGGSNPKPAKPKRQINLTPLSKSRSGSPKPPLDIPKLIETRQQALPAKEHKAFGKLAQEVAQNWPTRLQPILIEALYQLSDYQNTAYARRYLELVEEVYRLEREGETSFKLTETYAKTLAMRMTYEDAVRVAMLKLRPGRLERIRQEMKVGPGQVLQVVDYLKPDAAEVYGIFPNALVSPLLFLGKVTGIGFYLGKKHFTLEQHVSTTSVRGYLTFRFLTAFKPLRLSSYRFRQEWKLIEAYTRQVRQYSQQNYELGVLAAESGRLVKGYGDTRRKMIATTERFYAQVLAPVLKWEGRAKPEASELAPFAVSLKAGELAMQLIGRNDEGIDRAEGLAKRILVEAKAGVSRSQILGQLASWAKSS